MRITRLPGSAPLNVILPLMVPPVAALTGLSAEG